MIPLERTVGPNDTAKPSVSAFSPALAAAYGRSPIVGCSAPMLLMLMIEPPSAACICSPTSAPRRNGPLRLTPMTLSKSSSPTALSRG